MLFTEIPLQKGKCFGKSLEVKLLPEGRARVYGLRKAGRRKEDQRSSGSWKEPETWQRARVTGDISRERRTTGCLARANAERGGEAKGRRQCLGREMSALKCGCRGEGSVPPQDCDIGFPSGLHKPARGREPG